MAPQPATPMRKGDEDEDEGGSDMERHSRQEKAHLQVLLAGKSDRFAFWEF
jgi:hypothetical protein